MQFDTINGSYGTNGTVKVMKAIEAIGANVKKRPTWTVKPDLNGLWA